MYWPRRTTPTTSSQWAVIIYGVAGLLVLCALLLFWGAVRLSGQTPPNPQAEEAATRGAYCVAVAVGLIAARRLYRRLVG